MPPDRILHARRTGTEDDWVIECSTGLVYHRLHRKTYTVTNHRGATSRVPRTATTLIREIDRAIEVALTRIFALEREITETQKAKNTV